MYWKINLNFWDKIPLKKKTEEEKYIISKIIW